MGSFLDPPEDDDEYMVRVMCRDMSIPCETVDECAYNIPEPFFQWRNPGDGDEWTEADLVATVMAQLEEQLPQPVVRTSPGNERASIVNIPTFFWVENWTGIVEAEACAPNDPTFCITGTAEPRMVLYPGEDGADPAECQGPGVPYEADSALDAEQQAEADDACTHTYRLRTGVDGRPTRWPAQVTVTWDITWTPAETVGTPQLELTTDVPREVNEIQAVVTD